MVSNRQNVNRRVFPCAWAWSPVTHAHGHSTDHHYLQCPRPHATNTSHQCCHPAAFHPHQPSALHCVTLSSAFPRRPRRPRRAEAQLSVTSRAASRRDRPGDHISTHHLCHNPHPSLQLGPRRPAPTGSLGSHCRISSKRSRLHARWCSSSGSPMPLAPTMSYIASAMAP